MESEDPQRKSPSRAQSRPTTSRRPSSRKLAETEEQRLLKLEIKLLREEEQRKKKAEQARLKLEVTRLYILLKSYIQS
jgi:hypothetical protein